MHYILTQTPCHLCKNRINGFFIWSCQKNVVYLHPQFHAGDVCTSSAEGSRHIKRRLLRFVLTNQNLANFRLVPELSNDRCPTGYRVILLVPILVRILRIYVCAYAYLNYYSTRVYFIFGVGFALSVLMFRAMREPLKVELANSKFHAFFVPLLDDKTN